MSIKMSLRFVKERFAVKEHLDSLEYLQHNRAAYKNMEREFLTKVTKELKGQFATKRGETVKPIDDCGKAEVILFTDGSIAKNPLFQETVTHRIARSLGQV